MTTWDKEKREAVRAMLASDELREAAIERLRELLAANNGNVTHAAKAAGMPLRTLQRWLALPGVKSAVKGEKSCETT